MFNNNLKMIVCGNLVRDWKLAKVSQVTSIAVHNGNETTYIDLVCLKPLCKGKKGDLLKIEGTPQFKCYNGKPIITIFCTNVTTIYEKTE